MDNLIYTERTGQHSRGEKKTNVIFTHFMKSAVVVTQRQQR